VNLVGTTPHEAHVAWSSTSIAESSRDFVVDVQLSERGHLIPQLVVETHSDPTQRSIALMLSMCPNVTAHGAAFDTTRQQLSFVFIVDWYGLLLSITVGWDGMG
jgi:phosphoserine aminotransferase